MTGPGDEPVVVVTGEMDDAGTATFVLSGDLDIASVPPVQAEIERVLVRGSAHRVVFDLGDLRFMDSSGLALLLQTARRVTAIEIRDATPIVRRVITATGLGDVLGLTS